MSRLYPIPYGAGVLLVPEYCAPHVPEHDDRIARMIPPPPLELPPGTPPDSDRAVGFAALA